MDMTFLATGLAIGLACLGVALGQGFLIFKTMDTIGKNPKLTTFFLTMTILGIALLESAAIYGLLVAYQILSATFVDSFAAIGVGLAIGLTGFGAGIGEGILISKSIEAINNNPFYKNKIVAYMILFVALIESSAIYGFIISIQILQNLEINAFLSIGAGLAIGIVGIGVPIGEGLLAQKALGAFGEDEKIGKVIIPFTILGIALIESAAIYGFIIATSLLGADSSLGVAAIGAALAIGLTGLGVALGESYILQNNIEVIAEDPKKTRAFIPMAVLAVALVESAAIYGLVIALQILNTPDIGAAAIGAGLAIGLAGLGVALGEGYVAGRAIFTAGIERSNTSQIVTYMVLFIALVESAAIYGLVIAFQILNTANIDVALAIGAGIAIGGAGLGVGLGEGILASRSIFIAGKRPRFAKYFLTVTILGVALVESAAIYGFVVAYQTLTLEGVKSFAGLGAGVAIGLSALGAGVAEGFLVSGCYKAMARNPENKTKDLTLMILFIALVEVLAIYGLFMAFQMLEK